MFPECQLFGTLGCHLCEVAEAMLMEFVERGTTKGLDTSCVKSIRRKNFATDAR